VNTVAVYNLKGGVGKTSTAVNLACLAAEAGVPTRLWDLDPQGAASWFFEVEQRASLGAAVGGDLPVGRLRLPSGRRGLDVIPASLADRHLDGELAGHKGRRRLAELAAPFGETHSLLLLDCPPSISRLAEHVFHSADIVLVPMLPTPLSLLAWERLRAFFAERDLPRKRLRPFFTQVDRRRQLHAQWLAEPPPALKRLLHAFVPYAAEIEYALRARRPVAEYAPRSAAAHAYRLLWQELRTLL